MRYAAVVAASVAVVGFVAFPRDGRSADLRPAPAAAAPAPSAGAAGAAPRLVAEADAQEDFRWSGRIARGNAIRIHGIASNVRAELTSGSEVQVVGRRVGDDADRVRIEVVQEDDGVKICTVYPRRDGETSRRRSSDPCRNHGDGDRDGDHHRFDGRVDFVVRIPAGVELETRTVAGDVEARGLRSAVDVATVAGNVDVQTTGTARANSVSGNVSATFGETDGEDMEFNSVSGNIVLRMAGDVGAEVSANTLSGEIESDFPLRMSPMAGSDDDDDDGAPFRINIQIGRQASGTIGRGGPELSINTISGNIRLERGR